MATAATRLLGGASPQFWARERSHSEDSGSDVPESSDGADAPAHVQAARRAQRRRRRRRGLRGLSESFEELAVRYERYAAQITRRVARRGKKWAAVERVRQRQRRVMLTL